MRCCTDHLPIFALREPWRIKTTLRLTMVEVPNATAPLVIGPQLAGALYTATGTILVNPYSGMDTAGGGLQSA
jgi:hypothetical protein